MSCSFFFFFLQRELKSFLKHINIAKLWTASAHNKASANYYFSLEFKN